MIVTDGPNVRAFNVNDSSTIDPCNHEEADTRMILHLAHAVNSNRKSTQGALCDVDGGRLYGKVMIRTVDTDVVVLALACFHRLQMSNLWIAFGTGKQVRYIPIHLLATYLGPDRCLALPFFHAFTGCATVYLYPTDLC